MKITEKSEKVRDFMWSTESIRSQMNITDGVPGIMIRIIEDEDEHLHVMMELGEKTTDAQVRQASWLARQWRDLLFEYQGTWIRGGVNEACFLMVKGAFGKKPSTIAKYLNQRIEKHLREYNKTVDPLYLDRAKGIMQLMGLANDDIEAFCEEASRCIEQNIPLIGPIYFRMVEQKIRHWKDTKEYKNIKEDL
jgi:hypothetical protein